MEGNRLPTFAVLIKAQPSLLSWTLDQWIKIFSQCGPIQSIEIVTMDLPHQFQCVVRFISAKAQQKACQLNHKDFSVFSSRPDRKIPSEKQIEEPESKTPSPSPMSDISTPDVHRRLSSLYHSRPLPQPGQATPRLPIARDTPLSQLQTPTMLSATPATPVSPGCDIQTNVVEPLENRASTPRPRRSQRNRMPRPPGATGGTSSLPRNNGHPLRIYRQQRVLPRTNSGRRLGAHHPGHQRSQRDCRDSHTLSNRADPLILAVEDTPTTPDGNYSLVARRDGPRHHSSSDDRSRLSEFVRRPSSQSADSSLHTSASGSVSSPRATDVDVPLRLYIRDQSRRGTVILEKEMSLHTLKAKVASVYSIDQKDFELWHPRLERTLACDGSNGQIKLEEAEIAMEDEIVLVSSDDFQESAPPPPVRNQPPSRFARMEQQVQKMRRDHRAKTSPNVAVRRSRAPPPFEIQPHESPMNSFSPPRVLPAASAVAAIQERRAIRRQRLQARMPDSRSLPLTEVEQSRERLNHRNRPVSTRRENIPSISVPGQGRSLSSINLRGQFDAEGGRQDSMVAPQFQSGESLRHKRKSSTRVRVTNPAMVIRRARRSSDSDGIREGLVLSELDWANNNQFAPAVADVGDRRATSRQQFVRNHRNRSDFAVAMNFVPGQERGASVKRGHSQTSLREPRNRQRRVKVNQPIPIRIESNPQLVRPRSNSRQSPRDYHSRQHLPVPGSSSEDASPNQALFFFSDEQEPLQPVRVQRPSTSAIGGFDPRGRYPRSNSQSFIPASPLETHSATPRDDELLARQLAQEMDEEQQEHTRHLLAWEMSMNHWEEDDDEKYLPPESPVMLIEPRRGFVVNEMDHSPDHLSVIFERFGAFSPENDRLSYEELLSLDDGVPKAGLSEREIWRLPLRALDTTDEAQRAGKCSVCQEEYNVGDELRRLPCMHEYHRDCIDKWLERSKKCPVDMNIVAVE